jgi:hypothetical protein
MTLNVSLGFLVKALPLLGATEGQVARMNQIISRYLETSLARGASGRAGQDTG